MIDKVLLEKAVRGLIGDTDYELVACEVSAANDILVEVDRLAGVDVDFCAELNSRLTDCLDSQPSELNPAQENYSLEVGSYSLSAPFKTRLQYEKNLGHEVEVLATDGKKYRGQLVSVDADRFSVDVEVMVAVEGKKRKQKEIQTLVFGYQEVKYTKYNLKF